MTLDRMNGAKRTDYCGTLTRKDEGKQVTVCGWIQRQRDLGGLIFADLRDRTGIVQLALMKRPKRAFSKRQPPFAANLLLWPKARLEFARQLTPKFPQAKLKSK